MLRTLFCGATLTAFVLSVSPVRADRLDFEMKRRAPSLVKKLQETGISSLAILKFRIQDGDTPETYADGALNTDLAALVTNELILAQQSNKAILLTAEAWKVANKAGIQDYRSESNRQKLTTLSYPTAWGNKIIQPDAYLTGVLKAAGNRAKVVVVFELFTKANPKDVKKLGEFTFASDRNLLADLGHSFQLVQRGTTPKTTAKVKPRGIFSKFLDLFDSEKDEESDTPEEEELDVVDVDPGTGEEVIIPNMDVITPGLDIIENPAVMPDPVTVDPSNVAGVKVEVLAGGTALPLPEKTDAEQGTGPFAVVSPEVNTRVTFKLTNTTSEPLAVMVLINGKNTIALEGDVKETRKWIVEPGKVVVVPGRLISTTGEDNVQVLKIVAGVEAEEARNRAEFVIPEKAGEIEFQVFRKLLEVDVDSSDMEMRARARSLPPSKYRSTLSSMQEAVAKKHLSKVETRSIKTAKGIVKRELVLPDDRELEKAKVGEEAFPSSLQPDGSLVIKLTPR